MVIVMLHSTEPVLVNSSEMETTTSLLMYSRVLSAQLVTEKNIFGSHYEY